MLVADLLTGIEAAQALRRDLVGREAAPAAVLVVSSSEGELNIRAALEAGVLGYLTYDQATTMFSETVDFLPGACDAAGRATSEAKRASCDTAERAIFRYSKWPTQAITYRLGKDQIYALRDEARRALGDRFSLGAFHMAFIQQGTIPAGYFGQQLIEQLRR